MSSVREEPFGAKLNLGCGRDIRAGWTNLDSAPLPGVDIVHDLTELPLPFRDESFDWILASHVLEHIGKEFFDLMQELHRILRPRGRLIVKVPHYRSPGAFEDPTHVRFFTPLTMDYFSKGRQYPYDSEFHFKIRRVYLNRFPRGTCSGFPAWHLKRYLGISLPIPGKVYEIEWNMAKELP